MFFSIFGMNVDSDDDDHASFSFLALILVPAAFGAVFQGSLFGLAGILPASYTTPIMSGQGLAGTFAAFSMICALASMWDTQTQHTHTTH